MVAPSALSPARWRSTGRAPIAQPPGWAIFTSPNRPRSGPITCTEARISRTGSSGASGWRSRASIHKTSPSKEHRAPSPSSTSIMLKTSPIRGTLRTTQGSLVRRDAAISLRTAFFAPLTRTSPLRGVPPSTVSVGSVPLPPAWRLIRKGENVLEPSVTLQDRKSTRLNSSHVKISYAVFCLKKKNKTLHRKRHKVRHELHAAIHRRIQGQHWGRGQCSDGGSGSTRRKRRDPLRGRGRILTGT